MARTFLRPGETAGYIGPFSPATEVFGTISAEKVYVEPNGKAIFDPSFNRGGDEILFESSSTKGVSNDYLARLAGSNLIITSNVHVGASIAIPVGVLATKLSFGNGTFLLRVEGNQVKVGTQVITDTAQVLNDVGPSAAAPAAALSAEEILADDGAPSVIAQAAAPLAATEIAVLSIAPSGPLDIFGTLGKETVHLGFDAKVVFDPSFNRGGDEIVLAGAADAYAGALFGSNLVLTNEAGASISIPVGTAGTVVTFDNGSFVLAAGAEGIKLGDQAIGAAAARLDHVDSTLDDLLAAAFGVPADEPASVDISALLPAEPAPIDQAIASSQTLLG